MLLVMLVIMIIGILAFLILRPRPSGTKVGKNPMKASISDVRSSAELPRAVAG